MIVQPRPAHINHYSLVPPDRYRVAERFTRPLSGDEPLPGDAKAQADAEKAAAEVDAAIEQWQKASNQWCGFVVNQQVVDTSTAATIGVPGANARTSSKSTWLLYSAFLHTTEYTELENNGQRFARRTGVGVRLVLEVTKVDADFGLNAAAVALAVEANLASVRYRLTQIGMPNQPISLMDGATFDPQALDDVEAKTRAAFRALLASDPSTVRPGEIIEPLGASRPDAEPLNAARATLCAALRVRQRVPLANVLTESLEVDHATLRAAYHAFTLSVDPRSTPTEQDAQRAQAWLEKAR